MISITVSDEALDVRLSPDAEADLVEIYRYVRAASQSQTVARQYLDRITSYLSSFEVFPERGSLRNDIRQGLRVVGFERTISVAFIVEGKIVVILRVAQNGQQLNLSDTPIALFERMDRADEVSDGR